MLTGSHPGAAAVKLCCVANHVLAVGQIELQRNTGSDGVSPCRPRGPPGSIAGRVTWITTTAAVPELIGRRPPLASTTELARARTKAPQWHQGCPPWTWHGRKFGDNYRRMCGMSVIGCHAASQNKR
jgi:hypothetical protein